jgi:hypothetical protein
VGVADPPHELGLRFGIARVVSFLHIHHDGDSVIGRLIAVDNRRPQADDGIFFSASA